SCGPGAANPRGATRHSSTCPRQAAGVETETLWQCRSNSLGGTMANGPYFTPRLFAFLRELKANNSREWFQANKARYVEDVQQPMLRFIADFAAPLARISRNLEADPRPVGGSMFRIHRDTRFARDKSPYKTHLAAHFRHRATTKDVHGPG